MRLEVEYAVPMISLALCVQRGSIPGAPVATGAYSSRAISRKPFPGCGAARARGYAYVADPAADAASLAAGCVRKKYETPTLNPYRSSSGIASRNGEIMSGGGSAPATTNIATHRARQRCI